MSEYQLLLTIAHLRAQYSSLSASMSTSALSASSNPFILPAAQAAATQLTPALLEQIPQILHLQNLQFQGK